jgi:hypothetical protein
LRAFAFLSDDAERYFREGARMGCLPLPILFVLGALIGRYVDGDNGMLWGSGIGLLLGIVSAGVFVWLIRRGK